MYLNGEIPDGAETCQDVENRAAMFFKRLLKELNLSREQLCDEHGLELDNGTPADVLLVSHGGWIRSLIKHFVKDFPSHFSMEKKKQICPNTGVCVFELSLDGGEVKGIECLQFYDKSHLI